MKINLEINIPADRQSVEELVVTHALLGVLADRIHDEGQDVPELIKDSKREVKRELDFRLQSDREKKLRILKNQRVSMATMEEKRGRLDEEIAALEQQLNPQAAVATAKP